MKANELLKCTGNYCCRLKGRSLARFLKGSTLCDCSLHTLTIQMSKANSLSAIFKRGSKVCLCTGKEAGKNLNTVITPVISAANKPTNQPTSKHLISHFHLISLSSVFKNSYPPPKYASQTTNR